MIFTVMSTSMVHYIFSLTIWWLLNRTQSWSDIWWQPAATLRTGSLPVLQNRSNDWSNVGNGFVAHSIGFPQLTIAVLMLGQCPWRWAQHQANNRTTALVLSHGVCLLLMIDPHWLSVRLMFGQRRKRWPNINPTLNLCVLLGGL